MRSLTRLAPLSVAALLLGVWEIGVRIAAIPQFILPAPSVIAVRFAEAWADGTMLRHLVPTVTEVTIGGLFGGALGLLIGTALGLSGAARRVVSPYLVAAQSTPILALGPVLVLWLGPGLAAKVAVCALITLFPVAISTLVALRDVDAGSLELMRSLGATRWQSLWHVHLPAARS
ncbi:MAG: ABC transporter permease, partial [Candidatus Limnocylindrus sp.]